MPEQTHPTAPALNALPLPALLSAALTAFTLECDDEVELGLADDGHDARFSLVAWLNIVQYLADGPALVRELSTQTFTTTSQLGFAIGCLERWGFVSVVLKPGAPPRSTTAEGFGSARRITAGSVVAVTALGDRALEVWPRAIDSVELRWERRHGPTLRVAMDALSKLAAAPGVSMPEGVPSGWMQGDWRQFPPGEISTPARARIPVVIGRALLAVRKAYEQTSAIPLELAANTLRVVEKEGTPISALHLRSGISSQTTGAQCTTLTRLGLGEIVKDSTTARKVLRLTGAGREAQVAHQCTIEELGRILGRDGEQAVAAARALLGASHQGELAIIAALTPPSGVRRSGKPTPALGRQKVAPAALSRNREVAAQTAAFLSDPFRTLPHYPVWDGNRGFGP